MCFPLEKWMLKTYTSNLEIKADLRRLHPGVSFGLVLRECLTEMRVPRCSFVSVENDHRMRMSGSQPHRTYWRVEVVHVEPPVSRKHRVQNLFLEWQKPACKAPLLFWDAFLVNHLNGKFLWGNGGFCHSFLGPEKCSHCSQKNSFSKGKVFLKGQKESQTGFLRETALAETR